MNTVVRRGSARTRAGQSVPRVLFVATTFAGLLGSAGIVGYKFATPEKPIPPDQYQGFVQFAPNEKGKCDRFEFDNRTGAMRWQGATWCSADNGPSPAIGPYGPMGSVRDYFRSR